MTERTRGKSSSSDWRMKWLPKIPMHEELNVLRCPFAIESLEQRDCIPNIYTQNLMHLQARQEQAPWTGYYALHQGAKLAVSNCYGVWFKIQCCDNIWAAIHPTCISLNLQGNALEGINTKELITLANPSLHHTHQIESQVMHQVELVSTPNQKETSQ
jgi:hypothetical protein